MRNLLIALVFLLGIIFLFLHLAEVQEVAATFQNGDWRFLLLACVVQAIWVLNVATSYYVVYHRLGLSESIGRLYLITSAGYFINVVAPSVGMGGIAVFITEARRRGYSTARVMVAGGLVILFDYASFLCVLTLGLIVLYRRNNWTVAELTASVILLAIAIVLTIILYLGTKSADALGRALAWMARQVNRLLRPFLRRDYLSEQRAYGFAQDAAGGLLQFRHNPESLLLPAVLGLTNKALMVTVFSLIFLAFKVPYSAGTLIAGFSIGYLFYIVSPTPAGIGFVEGALTLGLRSLNVPLSSATVVALAYRGVTFWLPLFGGMLSFRFLARKTQHQEVG